MAASPEWVLQSVAGLFIGAGVSLTGFRRERWVVVAGGALMVGAAAFYHLDLLVAGAIVGMILDVVWQRGRPIRLMDETSASDDDVPLHVFLCVGPACWWRGAKGLYTETTQWPRPRVRVTPAACLGHCPNGPVVWMEPQGVLHTEVSEQRLQGILAEIGSEST